MLDFDIKATSIEKQMFKSQRFCKISNALSSETLCLLENYLNFQQKHNQDYFYKDNFAKGRYADYFCESILLELQPLMEEICAKSLFPTFSYLRIYSNGDTLKKHFDRQIAEYSGTMTLSYESDELWPIYVDNNGKSEANNLDKGDLLIYKGKELLHWREEFKGKKWIQCFFHYVDANGEYKDYKFDKRAEIGAPPQKTKMNIQDKIQFIKGTLR
tara:strand:- start:2722 stop:3366 length:645 start_codon:yes stop_codon:yes gene_type:complete